MHLLLLLLLISVIATTVLAFPSQYYGVDVSEPVSRSQWSCLRSNNLTFAIVRVFRSTGSVDPNAVKTLQEAQAAGGLLGVKLFLTEFIAFIELGATPESVLSERSRMIMTYALCGFANVASIGIMVGGMTTLMPERRPEILGLAWKALAPGFLATCMAAAVVAALPRGMFG